MSASKDTKRGTWKVYIRYIDWMGNKQIKTKRGFQTKKEALAWEREFLQSQSKDMNMSFACYGNIRLISEVKSQLCNIENHLIRLESADNFDADKLEQLRMILELLNSLKENN